MTSLVGPIYKLSLFGTAHIIKKLRKFGLDKTDRYTGGYTG